MRVANAPRLLLTVTRDAVRAVRDEIAGRRTWVRDGRAHIEARGLRPDAPAGYPAAIQGAVEALDGVHWAGVNGVLGDVIVDFDRHRVRVEDLRQAIARVEREHAVDAEPRDRLPHPADLDELFTSLVGLTGGLLGSGVALAGRAVHGLHLPVELMSVFSALELAPGIRQRLGKRLHTPYAELALSLSGSALAAATQAPLTSLVDATLRAIEVSEALTRRRAWESRVTELVPDRDSALADPLVWPSGRPAPKPSGPIERHTRRARLATATAVAGLLPMSGPTVAARAVIAGAPKAARLGREAYATELARMLAKRGVLVRDRRPLGNLDRIDTVVIDAGVLAGGGTGEEPQLAPLAPAIVDAARAVGRVVVSTLRSGLHARVGADAAVAGGSRLTSSVRGLQAEGHVVALIATWNDPALAAADCGIGVAIAGRRPPWGADLLCGPGLEDAWLILHAAALARVTANRSTQLALLGGAAAALMGLAGPDRQAGHRASVPVNIAALASMAAGAWSANRLAGRRPPSTAENAAQRPPWHALPPEEAMRALGTVPSGLTDGQAEERRAGTVPDRERQPAQGLLPGLVAELDNPLTLPLAAGAGLSAANGSFVDAALVATAVLGNALLGATQRVAASRAVRRLAGSHAPRARLRRDGRDQIRPASELVPGDIVLMRAGDTVPADCRLLDAQRLEVDESSLTGESLPVTKSPAPTPAEAVAERSSILYSGTTVVAGTGVAVVVGTGSATEAGRSAAAAEGETAPAGGVEARLRRLTARSLPAAAGAAAAVLAAGALRGRMNESINSAVSLAVAAVPEGLPFAATVAQLAAARRLSTRDVLVRTPRTLEALGRVDVICFDKTGTLTEGRIDLRTVSDGRIDEAVEALTGPRRTVLAAALRATPLTDGDGVLPHPTDQAVVTGGGIAGVTRDHGEPGWEMAEELPFEPGRGFHAVLGRTAGAQRISVKGAPETVLPRCGAWRGEDGDQPLDEASRQRINGTVERLAGRGYRVLAVAERAASTRTDLDAERVERLTFLGLLGLADAVRPTAAAAVRSLRRAGVEVVMLTGDHPSTARAIAAELDMVDGRRVVAGPELDDLDEAAVARLATRAAVFARVSPADKVTIVRALRRGGRVVAVTGDGTNDAPAIRLADVGIAFGEKSTDAARQAADIVVTDERIETIVDAVIESRAMWRSVRESVALLVGGNLGEILFMLASSLLSGRPPLNARQLLLVNLFTDLFPALFLAARPPRHATPEALLREGPDEAVGQALTRDILARTVATSVATTAGWLAGRVAGTRGRANTIALASLVDAQLAQTALAARRDPVVLAAVAGSALALAGLIQFPPTSVFFGCRPLGPLGWTVVLAAAGAAAGIGRAGVFPAR